MRFNGFICLALSVISVIGCKSSEPGKVTAESQRSQTVPSPQATLNQAAGPSSNSSTTTRPAIDACALLTSSEVQSVQGEPFKETKSSGKAARGFRTSQCFFTLPTSTNSISLDVIQKGEGPDARNIREFWEKTFDRDQDEKSKREDGEREESAAPLKINGIGEEAFWSGSRVGGALHVLKGNVYLRISIGGTEEQASRIKKAKALAQKALAKL